MSGRPGVDVVVPFRGSPERMEELRTRLAVLALGPQDTLTIADNTPGRGTRADGDVVRASGLATPAYARNHGAERGRAAWLVFLDSDVTPSADLLDSYFDPPPSERTGLLAGGVRDARPRPGGGPVARYAHLSRAMSQDNTLEYGPRWGFAKTANAGVRREAFEAVGGFREQLRAGEDADLTYRLRAAGWELERREDAVVVHANRGTAVALARQWLGFGSAGAWLDDHYPGSFPARRLPGLAWWGARFAARGLVAAARRRDRDAAYRAVFEPLEQLSYEVGRSIPNERPLSRRSPWRALVG